jgi:hypothetical protein
MSASAVTMLLIALALFGGAIKATRRLERRGWWQ